MAFTVTSRSGSTARHSAPATPDSGSIAPGLVANSAAASSVSSRPPPARDTARSSFISRTGVVPPGTPGASRGLSANGHSMVNGTGLVVSGATTSANGFPEAVSGSDGTPVTGKRKRVASSRAGAP